MAFPIMGLPQIGLGFYRLENSYKKEKLCVVAVTGKFGTEHRRQRNQSRITGGYKIHGIAAA